jgi:hypothetical protein
MALILYPATGADSFISVVDATTVISTLTLHSATWTALTEPDQEVYLRIAYRLIMDGLDTETTPLPDPLPVCVGEAQALIAVQDLVYGFSASTTTDANGAIKKQKAGVLEVEYYDTATGTKAYAPRIPMMAKPCLESIGYIVPTDIGRLTQLTLGRS